MTFEAVKGAAQPYAGAATCVIRPCSLYLVCDITKDQWSAWIAAWLGWMLDAFDFTIFLFIMAPIAKEFGVLVSRQSPARRGVPQMRPSEMHTPVQSSVSVQESGALPLRTARR
jgi:hypothetical protein